MALCGAKAKSTGKPCRRRAMANGRCYLHGGKSLKGVFSPLYRGKGYSKYMPGNIRQIVSEVIHTADILELRAEIATVDALLAEMWKAYEGGVGPEWVGELSGEFESLIAVLSDPSLNPQERNERWEAGVGKVRALLRRGADTFERIEKITELIEQRRKLVDSEVKREIAAGNFIPKAHVLLFLDMIARAIREVLDSESRNKLIAKLSSLYDRFIESAVERGDQEGDSERVHPYF